jgi:hypothetical protein
VVETISGELDPWVSGRRLEAGIRAETGANMPRGEDVRLLKIMRNREPQSCTAALKGGPISALSFHVI